MTTGIYKITNLVNGKFYIGSSKDIEKRWRDHRNKLRKNKHINIYLQNSWNKYGENNFIFEILIKLETPTKKDLLIKEEEFINKLNPSYNIGDVGGGNNISDHPNLEEIKKRCSILSKQAWNNPKRKKEWKERMSGQNSPTWKGGLPRCIDCGKIIWYTSTRCNRCAKTGKNNPIFGTRRPKETRKKISDHHKSIPKKEHSFYGKHHSQKTKEKLSKIKLNKNGKKVKQIDPLTNKIIRIWACTAEAYRYKKEKNSATNCIRHVCNKLKNKNGYEYKTAYGFKWEWV